MFNLFKRKNEIPESSMKGYKVTNSERKRKYGIAANSLKSFKAKAIEKMQIEKVKIFLAQDGTEIQDEDYFQSLPPQTLFVIADEEKHEIIKSDYEMLYDTIREMNSDILHTGSIINKFVLNNKNDFVEVMQDLHKDYYEKVMLSSQDEHSEWFQGADKKFKLKEEVMARRGQDRIKGYFYKTKEEIIKSELYRTNYVAKEMFLEILDIFRILLSGFDNFSCIFNRNVQKRHKTIPPDIVDDDIDGETRTNKKQKMEMKSFIEETDLFDDYTVSLCNKKGDFKCQGLWNNEDCKYPNHLINPYASRETLILFQIWNLDHQIEISRTILPSLKENVRKLATEECYCFKHKRKAKSLSLITYFLEIFTVDNLKLVHIVCHEKGVHDLISKGRVICEKCTEFKILDNIKNKFKI